MRTTPNMGLTVWNTGTDNFSHSALATDWDAIDIHDHAAGRGVQISNGGLANLAVSTGKIQDLAVITSKLGDLAVTTPKLGDGAVQVAKIADGAVNADKLAAALLDKVGVASTGVSRRAAKVTATDEARSSLSYGLLPTADQVVGISLPTPGLIAISYYAQWKNTVASTGRAAIFIGANQLTINKAQSVNAVQEALGSSTIASYGPLATNAAGIQAYTSTVAGNGTDTTTGAIMGYDVSGTWSGGVTYVYANPGLYDVSVQFKTTDGTALNVRNRRLYVWTLGF